MRTLRIATVLLLSFAAGSAATRVSAVALGDFTAAATWNLVDSVGYIDSELGTQAIGVANIDSPTFTWGAGAPTVMGIAIKVSSRMAVPAANTITCTLRNSSDGLDVDSVTLNVSDIDNANGWYLLDFGGTSALINGKNYIVRCIATAATAVTLFRSTAGTTNFSKMIITSTTGAPAAGDQLHVGALWTAAGTKTNLIVTMDNNNADSFGPTVSGGPPQGMTVNKGGTFTWKISANTQFYLKGILKVYSGGTMSMGDSGLPIGAFTAEYRMASVANVDSGLVVNSGGTFNAYGPPKGTPNTLLTTDANIGDDHIHISSTTGWLPADVLVIASTSQTPGNIETLTIQTVDSATQVTFTGKLVAAHSGTAPTQGEVVNLTRKLVIRGTSVILCGWMDFVASSTVNISDGELYFLGSGTAAKRGLDINTSTGSFTLTKSSLHDSNASALLVNINNASAANISITYTDLYNNNRHLATTAGTWTVDHCIFLANTNANGANQGIYLTGATGAWSNNTVASGVGIPIYLTDYTGAFSGNTHHSNGGGTRIEGALNGLTITNYTAWRNVLGGSTVLALDFANDDAGHTARINGYTAFGNQATNMAIESNIRVEIDSMTSNGDTTFATANAIGFHTVSAFVRLTNSSFSQVAGIKTAHTNDIAQAASSTFYWAVQAYNTSFKAGYIGPSIPIGVPNDIFPLPIGVYSMKHNGAAGDHRRSLRVAGRARTDTAIFNTSAPSERLIPISASIKLESGVQSQNVISGGTVTFSAWVRKSVAADGGTDPAAADYNGAEPRLILKANVAVGIAADVVLDFMTVAIGNWELLTGVSAVVTADGILEAYVDCDGTAGWVNVDDWNGGDTGAYWLNGYPVVLGATGGAGGPKVSGISF